MHETRLIRNALQTVLDAAARGGARRVTSVSLGLGQTDEIEPETVKLQFAAFGAESIARDATVNVNELPPTRICAGCGVPVPSEAQACPACGSSQTVIGRPHGLTVQAIEVE